MHFFDTYALWELIKGNPDYAPYSQEKIVCSIFNAYEFYVTLRKNFDERTARRYTAILNGCLVEISISNVIEAVEMKRMNSRLNLSFIDCLGYIKAKELGIKFLTGDKEFQNMNNVEFVK